MKTFENTQHTRTWRTPRQTDGQTDTARRHRPGLCIVSRSKNPTLKQRFRTGLISLSSASGERMTSLIMNLRIGLCWIRLWVAGCRPNSNPFGYLIYWIHVGSHRCSPNRIEVQSEKRLRKRFYKNNDKKFVRWKSCSSAARPQLCCIRRPMPSCNVRVCPSVRLGLFHVRVLCRNEWTYSQTVFTVW